MVRRHSLYRWRSQSGNIQFYELVLSPLDGRFGAGRKSHQGYGIAHVRQRLRLAHSSPFIPCGEGISSTHMGVFWAQISPTALSVMQSGMIAPVDGSGNPIDAIFPSIAVDWNANVAITYTGVSSTIYPSTYATTQHPADAAGAFRTPTEIYAGTTAYTANNPAGWGVYGSTAVDPSDGTVWGYNQVGLSATNWATGIVHFSMPAP